MRPMNHVLSEVSLTLDEIFTFAQSKDPRLCKVKFCKHRRTKKSSLCGTHRMKAWRMRNPTKSAYATLRMHARKRRIVFTLTFDYFAGLIANTNYLNKSAHLTIDRIDASKGYTPGNVRVITHLHNSYKGAYEKYHKHHSPPPESELDLEPDCPF